MAHQDCLGIFTLTHHHGLYCTPVAAFTAPPRSFKNHVTAHETLPYFLHRILWNVLISCWSRCRAGDSSGVLILDRPGHVRPICVLAGRIAAEGNVVTILMAPNLLEKAASEISDQFPSGHEGLLRIRMVSMFDSPETQIFQLIKPFAESYPAAYETLYQQKPIKCATTGRIFEAAPAPAAVVLDFFGVPQMQATRALSGASVSIMAWVTGGASAILRLFGPESLGGLGDFGARIDAEAQRSGENPGEIGDRVFKHTEGKVINVPGLPPMYDWEFFPQKLPFEAPVSPIVRGGYTFLMECDGIIISTAEAYETISVKALDSYFATLSKPLYAVGPLLPPTSEYGPQIAPADVIFKRFLDEMHAQHGEHSVVFISFGTVFWPTVGEYVDEVVEAFIEKTVPFILCHASPFAKISKELSHKIENSGIGMLATWSPQQFILNHLATGWFLTHGGHGGIMEALFSGVPLICWPFDADQPSAAKHLTQNLNVAFELREVRTGLGLKPSYGSDTTPAGTRQAVGKEIRETIDQLRTHVGKEKRENVERLKAEMTKAWEKDGPARRALASFLKSCN
ncbi:UDP-Glycosyltransferase/glycogen phosphorylase [Mycena metata]|uniref:UDP-Glycosyltransferase/glycogen phosphorylase n=1 Tax=Mycena metata TaxID=1033252 RepID=A0AAD7IMI6_9AGAR|nr:UDP-Glycosyltransferase/glycogen phosphorylase [Mycena metata]